MKKIIGILTVLVMTLFFLPLTVIPSVSADDTSQAASGSELIAGNIPDKPIPEFKIELAGDKIKITTSPGGYFWGIMNLFATNDKFELICNEATGECLLNPESSGKYLMIRPVGVPGTMGSFGYNSYYTYAILIECHDNIVDIRSIDSVSIDDYYYDVCCIFEEVETVFIYCGVDGTMNDRTPFWLLIKGDSEKCSYYDENMNEINSGTIDPIKCITVPQLKTAEQNYKLLNIALGDFTEDMLADAVITNQKEWTIFKKENGKTTKYNFTFNYYSWDPEEHEYAVSCYVPYSLKSTVIPENDINLDGEFGVADVIMMQKWLHGRGGMRRSNAEFADICKDSVLDVFDLCVLKKRLLTADVS